MTAVDLPPGSPYGLDHLPYGVFSTQDESPRVGVRIGDQVLDVAPVAAAGGLVVSAVLARPSLNELMALGHGEWAALRGWLLDLLHQDAEAELVSQHLRPLDEVRLHLPFAVGDYVDFYASEQHATHLGRFFRPDGDALTPNWKHLPIGYHGRAGTVVVSGTDVIRPHGQLKAPTDAAPRFGPSARLDIEAELGFVVGTPSRWGVPLRVDDFARHVFGVVLVNDWSARDIQGWEYVPLGPFLGKSFATSVSAWVTPLAALTAARVDLPGQDPQPLEYLRGEDLPGFDVTLEVELNGTVVSHPPFAGMYWSAAQMLAHLTANGADVRTGDLFASGTVSGWDRDQAGSLIELTLNGAEPVTLADASTRGFLRDGDTVVIRATAPSVGGGRIALGEVTGTIRPAVDLTGSRAH